MPEGRRVGQPGHDVAKRYLLGRLKEMKLAPFKGDTHELPFEAQGIEFTNLAGRIAGKNPDLAPVLVGAHYDSVIDAPCADDNATAVAVTLGAAEHFLKNQPERDIVIAIFDSEEPPYFHTSAMGSTRFYEDHCAGVEQFACVIIMDLIGHDVALPGIPNIVPGIKELLFVLGAESHEALPDVVENTDAPQLKVMATLNEYVGDMSDHHAFRLGGEPFLFLSCGMGKYYHHPKDDMDWINLDKVHRVLQYVINLVDRLDETEIDLPASKIDPVEFEIRMIKRA
ncbi:MAG: M28 family peptidase, partial [Verrucomicrobiota bacterium]